MCAVDMALDWLHENIVKRVEISLTVSQERKYNEVRHNEDHFQRLLQLEKGRQASANFNDASFPY